MHNCPTQGLLTSVATLLAHDRTCLLRCMQVLTSAGERVTERLGEQAVNKAGLKAAEHAAEKLGERMGERMVERLAERAGGCLWYTSTIAYTAFTGHEG